MYEPRDDQVRAFILRDLVPAGLFIGRLCPDDTVEVALDYVIPQYRDLQVARFLYSPRSNVFYEGRGRRIWSRPGSSDHNAYFTKLGFVPGTADGVDALVADLTELIESNA